MLACEITRFARDDNALSEGIALYLSAVRARTRDALGVVRVSQGNEQIVRQLSARIGEYFAFGIAGGHG